MTRRSLLRTNLWFGVLLAAACNRGLIIEKAEPGEESPEDRWQGNSVDCPEDLPHDTLCTAALGEICHYDGPVLEAPGQFDQSLCACWEVSSSERRWHCYENRSAPYECPATEPATGEDCYGLFDAQCIYPERTSCFCSSTTGQWSCSAEASVLTEPPIAAADRPINALSDSERSEWCDWLAMANDPPPGFPEQTPPPVDENGYTASYPCAYGISPPACRGVAAMLTREHCQANLALSACEAPLAELSDCVLTLVNRCWPSPHGCIRYLERPNCSGTVVQSPDLPPANPNPTGGAGTTGMPGESWDCGVRVR